MIVEVKVPSPGESITEVEVGTWLVEDGTVVEKDQEIAEIESDKATLTIVAAEAGKISIKVAEGETIAVGAVICSVDTDVSPQSQEGSKKEKEDPGISEGTKMTVEEEAPLEKAKETKKEVSQKAEKPETG